MNVPENIFYTKDHEWARIDGKIAYVGITDYAAHSLGDITFVELPKIGETLKQAAYCATVESVKAASDVYAPLSGKVVAQNSWLVTNPELINQSAYEQGYFFSMEFSNEAEKAKLMDAASYRKYVEGLAK
ncbi:MAG: glycine cleavage system protein H [Candidatus Omnitrophica bacterium CG11_big_fil_rev_8_21_14_0_20_43_6]|nr:MAG: glycine cleavage system protein H [Candidatus Omnitrophica bacterium CG11_big_fil_rev_8_21_14_0_20_43_6]